MILVAALDVAPAKSPASSSTVLIPRSCASSAQADPVAPPPMTHRSNGWPAILFNSSVLLFIASPSKCDLGPESQDRCIRQVRIPAYADVVLKCRLQQKVRRHLQRIVQLECFFGTKHRATQQSSEISERIADLAVDETGSNAVFCPVPKWCIEAHTRCDLLVFTAYVARAPVKAKGRVQSPVRSRMGAE